MEVINSIPLKSRLPGLVAQYGRPRMSAIITVALTDCFEKMNVKSSMNGGQIVELSEMLIDSSREDFFAIEDLMLFLQGMLRGDYGTLYNRMDIPTFFEMFEKYRQRRHEAYIHAEEEQHAQRKAQGACERSSEERAAHERNIHSGLSEYYREKWNKND